jgi:hypothetical protein
MLLIFMRTHTYTTSEGSFNIPQDWKKLLGEDVLNKKVTVSSRLKSVYFRLGFSFEGFTQPGLFYYLRHSVKTPNGQIIKEGVYSRLKFQAHKAKEMGFTSSSCAELSSYGICRVFDSGNLKFKYVLKNRVSND